jgi:hypothetical protein
VPVAAGAGLTFQEMPEIQYANRQRIARKGKLAWKGATRELYQILIQYRREEEVNNIDNLLHKCPNPDEAIYQWAYANIPNIAIGHELRQALGNGHPKVTEWRARTKRKTGRKHNHLVWP